MSKKVAITYGVLGTKALQWRKETLDQTTCWWLTSIQYHPSLLQFTWKHNAGGWLWIMPADGASDSHEGSGFAQGNGDCFKGCWTDCSASATVLAPRRDAA